MRSLKRREGGEAELEDLEDWHSFSEFWEGRNNEKEEDMTKRVLSTTTLTTRLEVVGEVTIDIGIVLSVPYGGLSQIRYSSTGLQRA
jgi:hypothetical protein